MPTAYSNLNNKVKLVLIVDLIRLYSCLLKINVAVVLMEAYNINAI